MTSSDGKSLSLLILVSTTPLKSVPNSNLCTNAMPTEMAIPNNQQELVPGKDKSLAQIDEVQREKEAAIEIQRAYRGYCPLKLEC